MAWRAGVQFRTLPFGHTYGPVPVPRHQPNATPLTPSRDFVEPCVTNLARPGYLRLRLCQGNRPGCVVEHANYPARLSAILEQLLRSPQPGPAAEERLASTVMGRIWKLLVKMATWPFSVESGRPDLSPEGFAECLAEEWPKQSVLGSIWNFFVKVMSWPLPPGLRSTAPADNPFEEYYRQANHAAINFADQYRGSFLLNYGLGALAVFLALMVVLAPGGRFFWLAAELAAIATIVTLILMANRGRWHQKSIDCRLYAEQLRQMRYLWPLGRVTPSSRPPTHHAFGDPRVTTMNWRFRAVLRQVGMTSGRITPESLEGCWDLVCNHWVGGPGGQVEYHTRTAKKLQRIDHRLHGLARVLFLLTAAACVGHLWVHEGGYAALLTVMTAAFPAAAAAAHAVSSQGEFRQLAERSRSMASGLGQTEHALQHLRSPGRSFTRAELSQSIAPAAAAMIDEVTDWRILYFKPPIEPA